MNTHGQRWLVLFALVWPAFSQPQDVPAKVDEYVNAYVQQGRFSGSILVAKGGEVVASKGYDMADAELDVPNTPDTKFRLGSITKQFTAAAILQLQEKGKLSVDDKLSKYVADSPEGWKDITIQELLTHTSGVPNFTSFPDYRETMVQPATPLDLIARFKKKPLDFAPGTKFNYSNSGYILLGYIIEKVSGGTYEAYLKQNIFDPLDLQSTGYDRTSAILKHRASGYSTRGGKLANADYIDMSVPFSAGGLYSTTTDLYRWDRALAADKVLPKPALEKMFTPFKNNYGDGWFINKEFDRRVLDHGGAINGFATYIARFPDDDACIIVLGNIESAPSSRMGHDLAALLFGQPYDIPKTHKAIRVPFKVIVQYTGTYTNGGLNLVVTSSDDHLYLVPKGQGQTELFGESDTKFFMKLADAEVTFVKNADGKVTGMLLHQNGRDIRLRRVPQ
ncbi:MAG: serine hydrolase [Bryobacteraceae bacterium]